MRIAMSESTDSTSSFHLVGSSGQADSVPFVNSTSNKLIHREIEKAKFGLNVVKNYESDSLLKRLDESTDISSSEDNSPTKSYSQVDDESYNKLQSSFIQSEENCEDLKTGLGTKVVDAGLIISPIRLTEDIPISINGDEAKFSSVTSNIQHKLVYIPTTRQLVADKTNTTNTPETVVNSQISDTNSLKSSTETILNESDGGKLSIQVNDTSSLGGESDSLLFLSLNKNNDHDQLSLNNSETDITRINTGDSLLRTFNDTTSLSSLSTCTDFSVSAASIDEGCDGTGLCIDTGDGEFMEISLHSRNSFERKKNPSQDSGFEDRGSKSKKKGLSDFLTRYI